MSVIGRKLLDGHVVEELDENSLEKVHKVYPRYKEFVPLVKLQPGNWFLPECSVDILDRIQKFEFHSDDVVVATFPKSGTTWMIEIVWNLLHNPNLDNPKAKLSTDYRAPHIEASFFVKNNPDLEIGPNHPISQANEKASPGRGQDEYPLLAYCELTKSPRVLKTHLPYSLFPKSMLENCKNIYVARDPRDIITSRYHFFKLMKIHSFSGTLDDFIDIVRDDNDDTRVSRCVRISENMANLLVDLDKIYKWQTINNMTFNDRKSEVLKYGKNIQLKNDVHYVSSNGSQICLSHQLKDLGIIMSENATF